MQTKHKIVAALAILAVGTPGFAGEITGNGKLTPIKSRGVASSECAFSGRNDTPFQDGFGYV